MTLLDELESRLPPDCLQTDAELDPVQLAVQRSVRDLFDSDQMLYPGKAL